MGIFGIGQDKVKRAILKQKAEERKLVKQEAKERKLQKKTQMLKTETAYFKARAERVKAKKSVGLPSLPSWGVKIKKKRQGRRLSRRKPIGLI